MTRAFLKFLERPGIIFRETTGNIVYSWCLHCSRTYPTGAYRQEGELEMCPYAGCDGDTFLDAWSWRQVIKGFDLPQIPQPDIVYEIQ